jgi:hypothetical protein
MSAIKLSYYENLIEIKGVGHTDELIEELEKREPKRKTSREHKIWRQDYNTVVDIMNKIAGFKRCIPKK